MRNFALLRDHLRDRLVCRPFSPQIVASYRSATVLARKVVHLCHLVDPPVLGGSAFLLALSVRTCIRCPCVKLPSRDLSSVKPRAFIQGMPKKSLKPSLMGQLLGSALSESMWGMWRGSVPFKTCVALERRTHRLQLACHTLWKCLRTEQLLKVMIAWPSVSLARGRTICESVGASGKKQ